MQYQIVEVEATEPILDFPLSPDVTGYAVLVRRKDRPVDFWLESLPEGSNAASRTLKAETIRRHISNTTADRLLRESIREELIILEERPPPPSLCVAVCTRGGAERLTHCLDSLRSLDVTGDKSSVQQILIIDNAPVDDTIRLLVESSPGVDYVVEPKPGLDFARNRALRESTCELIAFLDDDVTIDRG